ncbi:carboxypeptidase regulatory-like domain-containing protein [Streptomyces olivaceoviridis]|uniref:carboxypeptidase regulatory-like domain-containing protein n=1 Tax=Streptomyces olivaceoviridis TaxID=1921 RepID=UPI0036FD81FA
MRRLPVPRLGRGRARPVLGAVTAVLLTALTAQLPAAAAASAAPAPTSATSSSSAAPGTPGTESLCGTPRPGHFGCFAVRRTDAPRTRVRADGTVTPEGYGPADLRSAYSLPADGGAGATIAIFDAYDNPRAEQDLAAYRAQYGLPACTTDNGCFRKTDQRGGADHPVPDDGWAGEISLDLDMVSAVAPKAHILLVEADSASTDDLGAAVNTAVALGARYVSNSYGAYHEDASLPALDAAYFDHPGTALLFSSGDSGYGVSYPASSPFVTSVGGTSLTRDTGTARGWAEKVWNTVVTSPSGQPSWGATGSGCSAVEPKPSFQPDTGCAGRSVADVSAVADPTTGVAVYNSFSDAGWNVYGGTSASAPIIAGVYALAGTPAEGTYPASYPYLTPGALHDVTEGDDASCGDSGLCGDGPTPHCEPARSCTAGPGYDGPTGLGTPDGLAAFRPGAHGTVAGTVTDRAGGRAIPGATVRLGDYHTLSSADGTWSLVVPPGTYRLTVSTFGYAEKDLGEIEVADGAQVRGDAALDAIPTVALSGSVRDGGGHGWGVYARLTVDGVPGTAFTDPATGHYTIRLPRGAKYTLRATGLYPGYRPATVVADLRSAGSTANLELPLTGTGVLPPGYAVSYHGGGLQPFDKATTPDGWSVVDHTDAGGWDFGDPLTRGNQTGGEGRFAQTDDYALGWAPVDTELISPAYDFSALTHPALEFDTALPGSYRFNDPTADVDVSTDSGTTWENVWHHTDVVNGPAHEKVALTKYAGEKSVRVRFHYTGSLTGFWQVDNVALGTRTLDTVPGGLLTGHVRDAHTGAGVLGATVAARRTPADSGRSIASPDDPAVDDGLYWAFSSGTGRQEFTADLAGFGYPAQTRAVKVRADAVTTADFRLSPAKLEVKPSAIGVTVPWGTRSDVTVRLRDTGSAPATVTLGEQNVKDGTSATAEGAPRRRAATGAGPLDTPRTTASTAATATATADPAWQPVTDLPEGAAGGIAATYRGVVYTGLGATPDGRWSNALRSYDPATGAWKTLAPAATKRYAAAAGFIRGKLYVTGGKNAAGQPVAGGEVYDPATDSWSAIADEPVAYAASAAAVVGDKLYVVGGCAQFSCGTGDVQVYDPATDTWSSGPAYPTPTSWQTCGTVDATVYCAGGVSQSDGGTPRATAVGYALDAAAGHWTPIADPPVDTWGAAGTGAGGRLLTAGGILTGAGALTNEAYAYDPVADTWTALPNLPQPLYAAASAPGWYVLGGQGAGGVVQSGAQVLPGWDTPHADVPWLGEKAGTTTVAPGRTVRLTVTADARAMGPADAGVHRARLIIDSDGPYGAVTVPVTMTVVPPRGAVHLTGTVTGAGPSAAPLAGAKVRVTARGATHTLRTAVDGRYEVWLMDAPATIGVTADAEGHRTGRRTVHPHGTATVTAGLTLTRR